MSVVPERLARLPARRLPGGLVVAVAGPCGSRALGLAGLAALPADVGLLLPRCRSIHTLGMRFPLDLLWLGPGEALLRVERGVVPRRWPGPGEALVRVDRGVPPRRIRSCRSARAVLEVRAGCADAFADALLAA